MEAIQDLLSRHLFDVNCDALKVLAMDHLLSTNKRIMSSLKTMEKRMNHLNGERLNGLSKGKRSNNLIYFV